MHLYKRLTAAFLAIVMTVSLGACNIAEVLYPSYDFTKLEKIFDGERSHSRVSGLGFESMEYSRPDIDQMEELAENASSLLDNGAARKDVIAALDEFFDAYSQFGTMYTLSMIRSDINIQDDYYAQEYAYCSGIASQVDKLYDDVMLDCSGSSLCDYLDTYYFGGSLEENYSAGDDGYTPDAELVRLRSQEAQLLIEYGKVDNALGAAESYEEFAEHNGTAAGIYIKLIKLRHRIAEKSGYDSYREYCYASFGRGYAPEDTEDFKSTVRQYIVPIYIKLSQRGDLDSMYYGLDELSASDCLDILAGAAANMGGDIAQAMELLKSEGLYCIGSGSEMRSRSYVTYISGYDVPFLFSHTEGYGDDILTVGHEFGHFVDGYLNYGLNGDNDSSEMFSQGMEYLLPEYLDDETLAEDLRRFKMLDTVSTLVTQASFNEFEDIVYGLSEDELTVDNINSIYARIAGEYGYASEYPAEYLPYMWISISHLFEMPFYVISYCVSACAAFRLYSMELNEPGSGLSAYLGLMSASAEGDFITILDDAGIPSPLSSETVKSIALTLKKLL